MQAVLLILHINGADLIKIEKLPITDICLDALRIIEWQGNEGLLMVFVREVLCLVIIVEETLDSHAQHIPVNSLAFDNSGFVREP